MILHSFFRGIACPRNFRFLHAFGLSTWFLWSLPSVVSATLPGILVSPRSTQVHVGDDASFTVYADGAQTYRWFVNGSEVDGDEATLVLHAVGLNLDRAKVQCLVGNTTGVRSTDEAILRVIRPTREMLTFTGSLTELSGAPVSKGTETAIDMVVDLYDAVVGGGKVYREVFLVEEGRGVPVRDGQFLVRLGTGRIVEGELAGALASGPNVHAQFGIGSPDQLEVLEPRVPLTAMPYAFSSSTSRLKGRGAPSAIGLEAPIGSTYLDLSTDKLYLRSFRAWVQVP